MADAAGVGGAAGHVGELVTEYLEGALGPAEHVAFETHVASCLVCARYLKEIRATIRLLGSLPPEPPSDRLRGHLLETFRAWRDGR